MPVSVSPEGSRVLVKTRDASDFEIAVLDRQSGTVLHRARSFDTQLSLTWRPDGGAIAFISSAAGNRQYRLSLWDLSSGELNTFASPLTSTAAPPIRWAPDGRSLLLYVGNSRAGELRLVKLGLGKALESVSLVRVSPEADYQWSPDGGRIAYIPLESESSIHQLEVGSSRAPESLAQLPDGSVVRELSWSADGQSLLYSAREPHERFFSLRRLELKTRRSSLVARSSNDLRHPVWLKDQQHFLYEANEGGISQLWIASADGQAPQLLGQPDESHRILGLSDTGDQVYTSRSRLEFPPDLVAVSLSSKELSVVAASPRQATGIRPRLMTVTSDDGLQVPVILWGDKLAGPDAKPRAIINVHGGPHLQELPVWDARTQYLLRQGMIVASVNYRGSRGYGADFEKHEDTAGQARDLIAVQRYLAEELGVPAENTSLLASSSGTRVAVQAAFLKPEGFGRLVLTSTVPLVPGTCPGESGSRRVLAFHGLNDNALSPSVARGALERCFGERPFGAGATQFEVFEDEGHQFHRSRTWARILSSLNG
ncbi:dipeptidyl aminopeptidase/acylaminoacyl peptidase [Archangium gephyra]|nr:dipeptidyl aminopeptidase/acylaminoacyl peptidase [Archangium gephyra]